LTATNQIPDRDPHDIAAPQVAIDRQIKERPVSKAAMLIEEESYRPDLTRFQRPFCADFAPRHPGAKLSRNRVELCLPHRHTPFGLHGQRAEITVAGTAGRKQNGGFGARTPGKLPFAKPPSRTF
jgi:hypothetical protein